MSDTPIFDQMVKEFYAEHSNPAGDIFVQFDSKANALLGDWLDTLRLKKSAPPAAGGVVGGPIYLPKEDTHIVRDELMQQARNWRARYKSDSPYIGFK